MIYGADGNDTINGNSGNDRVYGDAGNDKCHIQIPSSIGRSLLEASSCEI